MSGAGGGEKPFGHGADAMAQIRKAILDDTKMMGRRLSVDEARSRYAAYGIEADEAIAAMADEGLIRKNPPQAAESAGTARPSNAGFDAAAFSREMSSIVTEIVGEIERGVSRGMLEAQRAAARCESERETAGREEDRKDRSVRRHERRRRQGGGQDGAQQDGDLSPEAGRPHSQGPADMEAYRDQRAAAAKKLWGAFAGNLSGLAAAAALVYFLRPSFILSRSWWLILPALWAVSIIESGVNACVLSSERRRAEGLPDMSKSALEAYRALDREKEKVGKSFASLLSLPLVFAAVSCIFFPPFNLAVFLVPSAFAAAGSAARLATYFASRSSARRRILRLAGTDLGWSAFIKSGLPGHGRRGSPKTEVPAPDDGADFGPYAGRMREASESAAAIRAALSADPSTLAEMEPELVSYLGQLGALARATAEIERAVGEIPMDELRKDKEELLARAASGQGSEALKKEYASSIAEIEKQEKSCAALKEQGELLSLRFNSGVSQLRRMRIDAERLRAGGLGGALSGLDELRAKSEELSHSIEDLRKGYEEL